MGDFNETLYATEHFSRRPRPEGQMRAFRQVTEESGLQDLGWSGVPFTWDNRQEGNNNVKARIDRVFANAEFLTRFEQTRVWHGLEGLAHTLAKLQEDLSAWGDREFGNLRKKIRKLKQRIENLRTRSIGQGPSEEEKGLVKKLREVLYQEELWMKQRSRVLWLRSGDRNTGYFQAQAAQRKRTNRIANLSRVDGSGGHDLHELLQFVPTSVTEAMNEVLSKPFEPSEVKAALFQMAPSKAPGVDRFTAGFFQQHWGLIEGDLVPAILDFLNGGNYQPALMTLLLH
ncbi:uncharacterized protein [Aegilops tauschii subsp. strangulata]|uniref:uncharacterized protein n=1 Tax=Aegilops tauschii subsp. strangulata TaxID=200361 RepID=UPI003CC882E3